MSSTTNPAAKNYARHLIATEKLFRAAFVNAHDVFIGVLDEFPFHQVQQPGKGLLLNFFMLAAIDAPEQEKRIVYAQLRDEFKIMLTKNMEEAKAILEQPPALTVESSPEEILTAGEKAQNATTLMNMISVLAAVVPDQSTYETLLDAMKPHIAKLQRPLQFDQQPQRAPEPLEPACAA